jgi:hypothetical protein
MLGLPDFARLFIRNLAPPAVVGQWTMIVVGQANIRWHRFINPYFI